MCGVPFTLTHIEPRLPEGPGENLFKLQDLELLESTRAT